MKALQRFIVIKKIVEKKELTTGFQLSSKDQADNLYQEGLVLQVGEDVTTLHPQDRILYNRSSGHDLRLNGENVRMIQERDVALLLEDEDIYG